MHDLRMIREHIEVLRDGMRRRGKLDALGKYIDRAQQVDTDRRGTIQALEERKASRNSITQVDQLERELALVRRHGYSRDNEELELGVRCIAAGVHDDTGALLAGLSLSAPAERMRDDWIPLLMSTSARISEALGYEAQH